MGRAAGLLVERMLELAVGMANREHGAMRFAHHTFRYAAHQDVSQSRAPVRSQHDKVGAFVDRGVDNLKKWRADAQETARLESVLAQAAGYLVESSEKSVAAIIFVNVGTLRTIRRVRIGCKRGKPSQKRPRRLFPLLLLVRWAVEHGMRAAGPTAQQASL